MKYKYYYFIFFVLLISCAKKNNSSSSPDLDFFNLHGPVKELSISVTGDNTCSLFEGWCNAGVYEFDKKGNWINPGLYKRDLNGHDINEGVYRVERNDNGQIIKFIFTEEGLKDWHDCEEFNWEGDYLTKFHLYGYEGSLHYRNNVISLVELEHYYTQFPMLDIIRLSNFEFDDNGNWISCDWQQSVAYDTSDSNYEAIPFTNNSGKMLRQIYYY